jgi:hypothetical protein
MKKLAFGLLTALALGTTTAASAADVLSNSQGWINSGGSSNNSGFNSGTINNAFAGVEGAQFRNWFTFTLPTGHISSATLSIYNPSSNSTIDPNAFYDVFAPTSYTYAGLVNGVSFGNVLLSVADTGVNHYVDITLNSAGISYLNGLAGQNASLSGSITSNQTSCNDCVAAFGYSNGFPNAVLRLSAAAAVPEPATWAMMLVGFGLAGAGMRRRRQSVRVTYA